MNRLSKVLLLVCLIIVCVLFIVAQAPSTSGLYTYNLGSPNQIIKFLGVSGGTNVPVATGSALSDNGTVLTYTGTSMTINAAPVVVGLGQGDIKAQVTTTAATTDVVTVTGASATSNCTFSAANASAATNMATSFISAVAPNAVTLTHVATAGMIYNLQCTPA
jgi:hypothetical protein